MSSKIRPDSASADFEVVQETPRFQRVYWMREPHLRKLYGLTTILIVASATTGYDSMLVNTSQQIDAWNYFFFPELKANPGLKDSILDSKLAILVNMFNIGSIVSFFITPYIADHFGRRPAIILGCIFMICGGFLTAFCNGYGSAFRPCSSHLCLCACVYVCVCVWLTRVASQCTWAAASCSVSATRSPRWPRRCC